MKLAPKGSSVELAISEKYASWFDREVTSLASKGTLLFAEPVHEEITQRIYGCNGDAEDCLRSERASDYVLAGVRWNDDPPFRLEEDAIAPRSCRTTQTIKFTTQPRCWYDLFRAAERRAASGQQIGAATLLERSHFGDLQFIHGMASAEGEAASTTRDNMLAWAEFTWRIARGEFAPEADIASMPIERIASKFATNKLRIQDLFTLGNPRLRPQIRQVAFGSLLHMLEDSFADGHVARAEGSDRTCADLPQPGGVRQFHVYGLQDAKRHAEADSTKALKAHLLNDVPDVVTVGRAVLGELERGRPWDVVRPYFECVFEINGAEPAGPGLGFVRGKDSGR